MCFRAQLERGVTIASLSLAAMGCSLSQPSEDEIFGGPRSYRPEPGTYTYDGELHQHFKIPTLSADVPQDFVGFSLATVTTQPEGCWNFRLNASVDPNPGFWEDSAFCALAEELTRSSVLQFVTVKQVGSATTTTVTCDPPAHFIRRGMKAGDQWSVVCSGNSATEPPTFDFSYPFQSAGTFTFVGEENVDVGTRTTAAYHFLEEREISGTNPQGAGSYKGTQTADWWLSRASGLMLKRASSVNLLTDTGAAVGTIDYTETASWLLLTPEPTQPKDGGS